MHFLFQIFLPPCPTSFRRGSIDCCKSPTTTFWDFKEKFRGLFCVFTNFKKVQFDLGHSVLSPWPKMHYLSISMGLGTY